MDNSTRNKLNLKSKTRLLTGGGYWTSAKDVGSGIPEIRFSDGPTGLRPQNGKGDNLGSNKSFPATCFPTHSSLACSFDKTLIRGVGARIGEEAGFYSVDVLLAPALNVKRSPLCGRNFEYFSEDPYLNGRLGASFSLGVKDAGACACVKHFAVNNREFGRMVCDSVVDERTLREIYLTGFEIAIKESEPAAVMTAYNRLNGIYCNENSYLIDGILRGEWNFDGIVVSDWGGTSDRVAAVAAGADLEMPPCKFTASEVENAVVCGKLSESAVDKCADRIIRLAVREKHSVQCDFSEHEKYSERCAAESAVLLKNDGVLPLKQGSKFAVVGDMAVRPVIQGGGSSKVNPKSCANLWGCLKERAVGYARGYVNNKTKRGLVRRALRLCEKADTVVFCAGLYGGDEEGADRSDIALPENQTKLLKSICALGKKVVVVLSCGSAVETDWDIDVNALLYAGLNGGAGARAIADIIKGEINPSGKLAETFPKRLGQLPCSEYFNTDPYYTVYGEGMNVGYRIQDKSNVKYAFGYGLSYTQFTYSDIALENGGVSFSLTNSGGQYGGEAAQMYIRFPSAANCPGMQLKGFEKVFLQAGETKRVFIPFDEYSFRSYDTQNGKWVVVDGEYEVLICSSSDDIKLSCTVQKMSGCTYACTPQTSGLTPAEYPLKRDVRGRVTADLRTPFCELKNAAGFFGRAFAKIALGAVRNNATVYGSMKYLPLRTLAQFGKMRRGTINSLITMFNGKFLKGLFGLLKK